MKLRLSKIWGIGKIISELRFYNALIQDRRTPFTAKILLAAAFLYLVLPIDLLPDIIPLAGWIDDIIIVPAVSKAATKLVPDHILKSVRKKIEK